MSDKDYIIVFLHGWGGTRNSLAALASEVESRGFKTLVLEMPGHGETPEMDKPWRMNDFTNWLKNNLEAYQIEKYVLVGHSFGGKMIIDGVSRGVLNPLKIFLIDANGVKPKNSFKKSFYKNLSKIIGPLLNNPIGQKIRKPGYKYIIRERDYEKTSGNVRESFKLFNEEHFDSELKKISVPTIIIWGEEDRVTPLWMGEKMHSEIKDSILIKMEGTHGLPLKSPKEVALQIIKHL